MSNEIEDEGLIPLDELEKLKKNQKVRDEMITTLTDGGMPSSPRDVEVLLSVVNSSDDMIFKKATLKARDNANKTNENIADLAANLLLNISRNKNDVPAELTNPELGLEFVPTDVVPGEMDQGVHDIDYEEFATPIEDEE
jgi:hypothetical protein